MKKYILALIILVTNQSYAKPTAFERVMLIDDYRAWLDGQNSNFDWSNMGRRGFSVHPDRLSPAQIYTTYSKNIFLAEKTFSNKFVRVYGSPDMVVKNKNGEPVVVYKVDQINYFYALGVSILEAQKLSLNQPLSITCVDFKFDYGKGLVATCSLIDEPAKIFAISMFQQVEAQDKLNSKATEMAPYMKKILGLFGEVKVNEINANCDPISESNYDFCIHTMRDSLEIITNR